MSVCNTVSLSPTHFLFKFQVRFHVANMESASSHQRTRGCEYYVRTLLLSTVLSARAEVGQGELGHGQQPRSSQLGLWPWVRQEEGGEENLFLGSPFHLPHKTSYLPPALWWVLRESKGSVISAGPLGGSILVHPLSLQGLLTYMCVRVCREGWLFWPDLSGP